MANGNGKSLQVIGIVISILSLVGVLWLTLLDRDAGALVRHQNYAERTYEKREVADEVYRQLRADIAELKRDVKELLRRSKR